MRLSLSPLAAATALFVLTSCDLEVDNSAPPGEAPAAAAGSPDTAGGDTTTPPASGGATTPPAGGATTPPPGGTPTPVTAAATFLVKLSNMQYVDGKSGGTPTTIKVGDTVQWQNVDSMDHTATSDTALFNSALAQGASFKHTFTTAGSFPYHCEKHKSTMKGTIVVQ
ncbi:MAG: plastocyanin/azurin family copper-binding protein [Anaeromyxobacteraceae bacterium]